MEPRFHLHQLFDVAFEQFGDGHAGPLGDDLRDVLFVHLFLQHAPLELHLRQPCVLLVELALDLQQLPVAQLCHAREVAGALGLGFFDLDTLAVGLERADLVDDFLLLLPVLVEYRLLLAHTAKVVLEPLQALARAGVGLLRQRLALDLQLALAPRQLVELDGHRVDLHAQTRRRLVDQVDRLVGQLAVGDVALRQHRGGDQRGILDANAVVHLVALFQPAQDRDRVLGARLAHHHGLEAPFECCILLDVLAVLIDGRGADTVQFAACEGGLQQIRGVHGAIGAARSHERVQFVDEQDDVRFLGRHFLEHGLQAVLELAAELAARDHRAEVERDHTLVLEALGHVARDDALREPFDDGGLADTGIADQHGVVLGAPRQHLDDATDLVVAADHGIELALPRRRGEIAAILGQRLVLVLGSRVRDPLAAAHGRERPAHRLLDDAGLGQHRARGPGVGIRDECEQQVLDADVLILQLGGGVFRAIKHSAEALAQVHRGATAHARQAIERGVGLGAQRFA